MYKISQIVHKNIMNMYLQMYIQSVIYNQNRETKKGAYVWDILKI